jgi:hypothetical protein
MKIPKKVQVTPKYLKALSLILFRWRLFIFLLIPFINPETNIIQ